MPLDECFRMLISLSEKETIISHRPFESFSPFLKKKGKSKNKKGSLKKAKQALNLISSLLSENKLVWRCYLHHSSPPSVFSLDLFSTK